jgi:SAM-dependent methyltransferase
VLAACRRFGVKVTNARVLDLGCSVGALSVAYADAGASAVIGVDVDADAIARARPHPKVTYRTSTPDAIPLNDASVDVVLSYDVFEHVAHPPRLLAECHRVLRPNGVMLIGTWGWGHPFAPHLWSAMPVPWAHVLVSERTLYRACRRVYWSPWYVPTYHDIDERGQRRPEKYTRTAVDAGYLNKYRVRDFERAFDRSGFRWRVELQPFGSAPWTAPLLRVPVLREYLHGYLWAVLSKNAAHTLHT